MGGRNPVLLPPVVDIRRLPDPDRRELGGGGERMTVIFFFTLSVLTCSNPSPGKNPAHARPSCRGLISRPRLYIKIY